MTWLERFNAKASELGIRALAVKVGLSPTTVSQVCNNKYKGNLDNVRAKFEAVYHKTEAQSVTCPILGDIPITTCLEKQKLPFAATNPQRVQLFRACRGGCPNCIQEECKNG